MKWGSNTFPKAHLRLVNLTAPSSLKYAKPRWSGPLCHLRPHVTSLKWSSKFLWRRTYWGRSADVPCRDNIRPCCCMNIHHLYCEKQWAPQSCLFKSLCLVCNTIPIVALFSFKSTCTWNIHPTKCRIWLESKKSSIYLKVEEEFIHLL